MLDPRTVPAAHSMDTAWFGVDTDGNLALFDTGEAGALPTGAVGAGEYADQLGAHADGFEAICAAVGMPQDYWEAGEATGECPVFHFEHEDDNWVAGRYVARQAPATPARIDDLPPELRAGVVPLPVKFAAGVPIQPVEHVKCDAWGAVWLSSDGAVARPFPGREGEAAKEWEDVGGEVRFERDPGVAATVPAFVRPPTEGGAPRKPWWKFW